MLRKTIAIACIFAIVLTINGFAVQKANGLQIGDTVQPFAANDQNGDLWSMTENLDKQFLVVYFYPAAMTGG